MLNTFKLFFFLTMLVPFAVQSQFEIKKENLSKKDVLYWDFNKTMVQSSGSYYVDGLGQTKDKHGLWKYYDKFGDLEEERNYYRGKLNGKVMMYYSNGKPRQEGYFKVVRMDPLDPKRDTEYQDSVYREWNETGTLSKEGMYKLGQPIGIWKNFYVDGREKSYEEEKDSVNYLWSFWLPDAAHTQTVKNGTGEVVVYHSTGTVKEWYNYKNGLMDGPFEDKSIYGYVMLSGFFKEGEKDSLWKYYYYTGDIEKTSTYKNNKLNGPYNYFYDTGKLNVTGNYVNGKKEGVWKWFTKNETPDMQGSFKNDLQEGEWIYWYPTGEKSYTAYYKANLKTGHWTYLYKDGTTFKTGDFAEDLKEGRWQTWYENGTLLMDGVYSKVKEEGVWTNYWDNGKVKNATTFKHGEMNGAWLSYYPSGNKKLIGKYKNNYKVGKWTDYYENGMPKDIFSYKVTTVKSQMDYGVMKGREETESVKHGHSESYSSKDFKKTEEGNYKNGQKDGEWIDYYPGGKVPAIITHYKNGELDGTMKQFDRMGKLTSEINYAKGLKDGPCIIYDEKGKVISKKMFSKGGELRQ